MIHKHQQVQRVLIITLILNFTVAAGKIMVGLMTGALAITADGFHSLIDGASNVVGLVATRIAQQPPDEDHPYGHGRYETLAALFIGAFLILAAWEISWDAIGRLRNGIAPQITILTFTVLISTLLVNIVVSTYQLRMGRKLQSEILLADAANTRADVFVTLSVLTSMALITLTGWVWLDAAAALIVVLLIAHAAWKIVTSTGRVLVDTAPYSGEHLKAILDDVPSVQEIVRARSRGSADAVYIDIDVQVAPQMTTDHTAALSAAIREKLASQLNGVVEVDVHFMPQKADEQDYTLIARAAADTLGLATHEVGVIETREGKIIDLHVEVTPSQTLDEAHSIVSLLERSIQTSIPNVLEVVTHIEPAIIAQQDSITPQIWQMKQQIADTLRQHLPDIHWHHLRVYDCDKGLTLTMHAAFASKISVEAAHDTAEQAETLLRLRFPQVNRITIHTEPAI